MNWAIKKSDVIDLVFVLLSIFSVAVILDHYLCISMTKNINYGAMYATCIV